uniref:PHD-type domain-containing protein n=1 Tax=Calcidiscus leptoporus TaxID=127549 RepID=A0A7S0NMT7_9EUKA|mmetsp:Transcript_10600/g.24566  ORF Transcript_10600/g.24566 Transcript_10600/m.24566 type:complete len:593 (+) Transcript_10600:87-1865(+)
MTSSCFEVGELVCARWGEKGGFALEAVITEFSEEGIRVCFETDPQHPLLGCAAWLPKEQLKPLRRPNALPDWLKEGAVVRAHNPSSSSRQREDAVIVSSRVGASKARRKGSSYAGLRFQLQFSCGARVWVQYDDLTHERAPEVQHGDFSDEPAPDGSLLQTESEHPAMLPRPLTGGSSTASGGAGGGSVDQESSVDREQDDGASAAGSASSQDAVALSDSEQASTDEDVSCQVCGRPDGAQQMLLCDRCDEGYHLHCLSPQLEQVPEGSWVCPACDQDASAAAPNVVQGTCSAGDKSVPLENNDAVLCQWGRGTGKAFSAVVSKLEAKAVCVQFDVDHTHARVPQERVTRMPAARDLPDWLASGRSIEAVDPLSPDHVPVWHAAVVLEARQGAEAGDDGLRLWIRYRSSCLCQWVRLAHVRPSGTAHASVAEPQHQAAPASPAAPSARKRKGEGQEARSSAKPSVPLTAASTARSSGAAAAVLSSASSGARGLRYLPISRLSRDSAYEGECCAVWLLLVRTVSSSNAGFTVCFGEHESPGELIAPRLLACLVPSAVAPGVWPLYVLTHPLGMQLMRDRQGHASHSFRVLATP